MNGKSIRRRPSAKLIVMAALLLGILALAGCRREAGQPEPGQTPAAQTTQPAQETPATPAPETNANVLYEANCATCHGSMGEGGLGPALAGNSNLQDAGYVITRVMRGSDGMPAFAALLPETEVAETVTHIRTSWGNDFGAVTLQQVQDEMASLPEELPAAQAAAEEAQPAPETPAAPAAAQPAAPATPAPAEAEEAPAAATPAETPAAPAGEAEPAPTETPAPAQPAAPPAPAEPAALPQPVPVPEAAEPASAEPEASESEASAAEPESLQIPEGQSRQEHAGVRSAVARLADTDGNVIGTARFIAGENNAVNIQVQVSRFTDATAGEHALIIHEKGSCTPAFAAAGGHFNPTGVSHGLLNPAGPHAGDLPNITIDGDGNAFYRVMTERVVLDAGRNSLFHAGGSALLIHAAADDLVSQPGGNAGEPIACGVITTGSQQR